MKIILKKENKIIGKYTTKSATENRLKLLGFTVNEIDATLSKLRKDEETIIEVG